MPPCADESLELPPPPHVVSEVMRLTRGDGATDDESETSTGELAQLIQRDMALAGTGHARRKFRGVRAPHVRWSRCRRPSRGSASARSATSRLPSRCKGQVFASTYFRNEWPSCGANR